MLYAQEIYIGLEGEKSIGTKEREKHIYRLVNWWENKRNDFDQVKCIKDEKY